jgi:hypothetical protein
MNFNLYNSILNPNALIRVVMSLQGREVPDMFE